jgi:hypothetical protein
MKLEFSRQIFEKYKIIDFHENPSSESRIVPREQTERHVKGNSRFPQVGERAKKSASYVMCIHFLL